MRHRLLLVLCAASLLVGALPVANDREELEKAARRMSHLDSYAFTIVYAFQGPALAPVPYEVKGKWQRGIAYFTSDLRGKEIEAYRMNERVVARKQGGDWEPVPPKGSGGHQRGHGINTPHEELENLRSSVRAVSRTDGFEMVNSRRCVAYEAEVTAQGTRDLIPVVGIPIDTSDGGRARIWVDDEGIVQKYAMVADVKISVLGKWFTIKAATTTEISDVGHAGVTPPDEVMRLLKAVK